jgi:glutamate--cysteine ligase
VLASIDASQDCAYTAFVRQQSQRARDELLALPWSAEQEALFEREARVSLDQQKALEASDSVPFETFRQNYVSAERLLPASARLKAKAA